MIVITNPSAVANEISVINSLFEEGLSLVHIRKPIFSEFEMAQYVHQIKLEFRSKLILHSHHQLADDFGIDRIHFSEKERKTIRVNNVESKIISTATHSVKDFNSLSSDYEYAFLSPVYASISKENYFPKTNLLEDIKQRTNFDSKMVALGGIHSGNIEVTLQNGFDNIALLGTIWNNDHPTKQFKLCQQIVHSYLV